MGRATKVKQLFVHICFGTGPEVVDRISALAPAGFTKFFGPDATAELDTLEALCDEGFEATLYDPAPAPILASSTWCFT